MWRHSLEWRGETMIHWARLNAMFLVLMFVVMSCSKTPEEVASEELAKLGFAFTADDFVEAAAKGDRAAVDWFLMGGMSANTKDASGQTVLCAAAADAHKEIVETLFANGADVNMNEDIRERTPLIAAAAGQYSGTVAELQRRELQSFAQNRGRVPIAGSAAEPDRTEIAFALLQDGADPNAKDSNGMSPLAYAAFRGDIEMVKALLEKGADVSSKDKNGNTPLLAACMKDNEDISRLLMENGADFGITKPLSPAVVQGSTWLVKALLEKGADVNEKSARDGVTALMYAARLGHKEIVSILLENGADVNATDRLGRTALAHASKTGQTGVIKMLKEAGARR